MSGQNDNQQQQNQEVEMVGNLPLVQRSHFQTLGDCSWDDANDLVALQKHLHERGNVQDDDVVPSYYWNRYYTNDRDKENELTLVASNLSVPSTCYDGREYMTRRSDYRNSKPVPFHYDILPHWKAFAEQQKNRKGLVLFKIEKITIPPSPFFEKKMLPVLKNNTNLVTLELKLCNLDADDIGAVAKLLKKNKSLSTLDLSGNKISCPGAAKSLAKAMENHEELCFVNLTACKLGGYKNNTTVLSNILGGCTNLESLILDYNRIGRGKDKNEVKLVTDFIATNESVTVLSLRGNDIDNAHDARLSKALKKNDTIQQLCLGGTGIAALPKRLFGSKRVTENLTHLDLSQNKIRTPGAKLIAKYLKGNPTVVELNLGGNKIPHAAAKDLVEALKQNTNLESLELWSNLFNNKSVPDFVDLLKNNTTLLCLDLSNNNIKLDKTRGLTGKKELIHNAIFDTTSLDTIASSNHTCELILTAGKFRNDITNEDELKKINSLDVSEGKKIRYKVVMAMFTLKQIEFSPTMFNDMPLELMPYALSLVQQEMGFKGFGRGIMKRQKRERKPNSWEVIDPSLGRLHSTFTEWQQSIGDPTLLVARGPGKKKRKKAKKIPRKRKAFGDDEGDDDEEWNPNKRGAGW